MLFYWLIIVQFKLSNCKWANLQHFITVLFIFFSVCTGETVAFVWPRPGAAQQPRADPMSRPGQVGAGAIPPYLHWLDGCWHLKLSPHLGHQLPGCTASRYQERYMLLCAQSKPRHKNMMSSSSNILHCLLHVTFHFLAVSFIVIFMCNINMYLEWSGWFLVFCLRLSDWHCIHFTALWLCLSAGASEVKFWFAVVVPVFPDWPQHKVTVLWPHPPAPLHTQTLRLASIIWQLPLAADSTFRELCYHHPYAYVVVKHLICIWMRVFGFMFFPLLHTI